MTKLPCNQENMKLWIADLRSGKHKQGTGALAYPIDHITGTWAYCCLGRAQEVAIANGVPTKRDVSRADESGAVYVDADGGMAFACLTPAVIEWLGLKADKPFHSDPIVRVADGYETTGLTAASANDMLRWPFDKIADALEALYIDDEPAVTDG